MLFEEELEAELDLTGFGPPPFGDFGAGIGGFGLLGGGIGGISSLDIARHGLPLALMPPMIRIPPPPHRLARELPFLSCVVGLACLMALHTYSLSCAALLLAVSLLLTYIEIYRPRPPNCEEQRWRVLSVARFSAVTLVSMLLLRYLQSSASRLLWGTPRFQLPWTFVGCWLSIFATVCYEAVRLNGRLSIIQFNRFAHAMDAR